MSAFRTDQKAAIFLGELRVAGGAGRQSAHGASPHESGREIKMCGGIRNKAL
jgi:hypothetical protein